MGYIRDLFFKNLLLKLIALFFAIVLWINLSPFRSRNTLEVNYVLPLQLKNIPEDMVTVGKIENHIGVRLKGTQGLINDIDPSKLSVTLDLSKAKEGVTFYKLNADNIVNLPPGVDVVRIDPNVVKITMAKLVKKEIDLKVLLKGKPAPGYIVKSVSIDPPRILIQGPRNAMGSIEKIKKIPINIEGLDHSISKTVRITLPIYNVKILGDDTATIYVEVAKE